jgi:hypothetical protein
MTKSSSWSVSFRFPHRNPTCTNPLPHTCHMSRLSYCSWFDHPNNIWWSAQVTTLSVKQFPLAPATSSASGVRTDLQLIYMWVRYWSLRQYCKHTHRRLVWHHHAISCFTSTSFWITAAKLTGQHYMRVSEIVFHSFHHQQHLHYFRRHHIYHFHHHHHHSIIRNFLSLLLFLL